MPIFACRRLDQLIEERQYKRMEHLLRQDQKIIPDYVRVYESVKGGWVDLHPWHGKDELADNMEAAKILADKGHCLQLLPVIDFDGIGLRNALLPDVFGNKNPDVRIVGGRIGDIKKTKKEPVTKTVISDAIYRAGQQKVEIAILNLFQAKYSSNIIRDGLLSSLQPSRNRTIREVWIITFDRNLLIIPRKMVMAKKFHSVLNSL